MLRVDANESPERAECVEDAILRRWMIFCGAVRGIFTRLLGDLRDHENNVEKRGSSDDGGDACVCEVPAADLVEIVEGAADADEKREAERLIAQCGEFARAAREVESDHERSPCYGNPLGGKLETD